MVIIVLISILILIPANYIMCQERDYELYISTMEVVDKNGDGRKDGIEVFYILKEGRENIELTSEDVSHIEAYLYEDRKKEALMSFWQIDVQGEIFSGSIIYLPFRPGFAYNIYKDKIVPAFLKIRIIFGDDSEIESSIKDRLSFLSY